MNHFYMNGILWHIRLVPHNSPLLVDRTGNARVATTDPISRCIYVSYGLDESYFDRVLIHELGHCALFSFDLIRDIHKMVRREFWIEAEEWICNFIADYGMMIFFIAGEITTIPRKIELLVS